ncbi:hypothetical protein T261_6442 [Streptomyces lydicus]|nr:hypothetical protein T261_6442 [Streptomyces lydicus]
MREPGHPHLLRLIRPPADSESLWLPQPPAFPGPLRFLPPP